MSEYDKKRLESARVILHDHYVRLYGNGKYMAKINKHWLLPPTSIMRRTQVREGRLDDVILWAIDYYGY